MLAIDRVLETALYVDEMGRAVEFYQRVFGLAVLERSTQPDRLTALDIGGAQVLLLCKKGARCKRYLLQEARFLLVTAGATRIWLFLSRFQNWKPGRNVSWTMELQSRVRCTGSGAAKVSISAILTETCWNWSRQEPGRPTELGFVLSWRLSTWPRMKKRGTKSGS